MASGVHSVRACRSLRCCLVDKRSLKETYEVAAPCQQLVDYRLKSLRSPGELGSPRDDSEIALWRMMVYNRVVRSLGNLFPIMHSLLVSLCPLRWSA